MAVLLCFAHGCRQRGLKNGAGSSGSGFASGAAPQQSPRGEPSELRPIQQQHQQNAVSVQLPPAAARQARLQVRRANRPSSVTALYAARQAANNAQAAQERQAAAAAAQAAAEAAQALAADDTSRNQARRLHSNAQCRARYAANRAGLPRQPVQSYYRLGRQKLGQYAPSIFGRTGLKTDPRSRLDA